MGKFFGAWLIVFMLVFSACSNLNQPKPSPTTPPTRVLSFVTPSPSPTNTVTPSPTYTPTPLPYALPSLPRFFAFLLNPPPPSQVNGLAYSEFVVMSPAVQSNIQRIYAIGQQEGR